MEKWILAVDYDVEKFEVAQKEWLKHHIFIHMVSSMQEAITELSKRKGYLLVAILSETTEYLSWMKALRDTTISPIIVMKAEYDGTEKIKAIELGADEYIACPTTIEESVASCQALIRRFTEYCNKSDWCATVFAHRDVFMCLEYRRVFVRGREIELTKTEFDLLHILVSNRKRVYKFEQLYELLWGDECMENVKESLQVHVKRLRKKIKIDVDIPEYIKNVHDVGYKFDSD